MQKQVVEIMKDTKDSDIKRNALNLQNVVDNIKLIEGKMTTPFIDTNIPDVAIDNISKLNLRSYIVTLYVKGTGSAKRSNHIIVELSRFYYLTDGVLNEQRQCYYPKDTKSSQGIAGFNRLEKLFKKWGFESL